MKTRASLSASLLMLLASACGGSPSDVNAPVHSQSQELLGLDILTVTQNVLPGLANATDLGSASSSAPMRLVLSVRRPNVAGEKALLNALHDPSSASFGHFLSPAEFAQRFGVPASQLTQVKAWASSTGLHVDDVSAAGDQLTVSGSVAQVDALLRTATHRFSLGQSTFLANTAAPVVPLSLGLLNIVGLNSLQHFSTPARALSQTTCVGTTCIGNTTPQDLWSVYQQPAAFQGEGQKIGIFGEGQTDGVISDLRLFEDQNGLPHVPVVVKRPAGETDFSDNSGLEEWNIDTQSSTGMAPQASALYLYFGQDLSDASITHSFSGWVDDPSGPLQASASFGECETVPVVSALAGQALLNPSLPVGQGLGNNVDATFDAILRQGALEGRTLFASTGDTGSSCPVVAAPVVGAGNGVLNQAVPITNSPASLPYVVGVGGTVLYTDGAGHRTREYGWAFSGGGSTFFVPAPDYQLNTAAALLPCLDNPLASCRGVSDVAAQSGDVVGNGFGIVSAGAASTGGGTSLSSPLWVGMWARVQSASLNPQGNGFANYSLYRVGNNPDSYARDFFDVSSTDTTTGLPATNGLYATTPGWDFVTGFGTPRVSGLICDIDHRGC